MTNLRNDGRLVGVESEDRAFYPFCVIDLKDPAARRELRSNLANMRCDDRLPVSEILKKYDDAVPASAASAAASVVEDIAVLRREMLSVKQMLSQVLDKLDRH